MSKHISYNLREEKGKNRGHSVAFAGDGAGAGVGNGLCSSEAETMQKSREWIPE